MACTWVAEIGNNHASSWDRALALIHAAHEVGCDAVKFQLGRHDKLWAPEVRKSKEHLIPYELPLEWLPEIRKVCDELGLKFGCTPLYLEAVKELEPWVDFWKISSYEAMWVELFDRCHATRKPIVVSLGLVHDYGPLRYSGDTLEFNLKVVWPARERGPWPDLTVLHCVSKYPTPPSECYLGRLGILKEKFSKVGYSDHSVNPEVIKRAVLHWGAEMVEFHLDLQPSLRMNKGKPAWNTMPGPEAGHSWEPHQIKPVIEFCKVDDGVWPGWEEERKWQRGKDGLRPTEEVRGE